MNVVAVYNDVRGPGFWPYLPEHVMSLRTQLARFGHELTVLGWDEPLYHSEAFAGWWSKMLVYSPEYEHLRPMLALDLDNFVMNTLDPILALDPNKLWLIRKFLSRTHEPEMGLCTVPDGPLADAIWQVACTNNHAKPPGDLLGKFPHSILVDVVDGIYSYKAHCLKGCPPDARMVLFHGSPKAPDLEGWAKDWWLNSLSSRPKN